MLWTLSNKAKSTESDGKNEKRACLMYSLSIPSLKILQKKNENLKLNWSILKK